MVDVLREQVRDGLVDQIRMQDCYQPGDIVVAKYLSQGDGRRVYASTAEPGLGVKYAKGEFGIMLPVNES
jgi:exosome complex RNA-binding protein Csl4